MLIQKFQECVDNDPEALRIFGMLLDTLDPSPTIRTVHFLHYMDLVLFTYPFPGRCIRRLYEEVGQDIQKFRDLLDALHNRTIPPETILAVAEDLTNTVHLPFLPPPGGGMSEESLESLREEVDLYLLENSDFPIVTNYPVTWMNFERPPHSENE